MLSISKTTLLGWLSAVALSSGFIATACADTLQPAVLPPTRFRSDPLGAELFKEVVQAPRFHAVSSEIIGTPIELRIYQTFQLTSGGKASGTVSGLLAASTLGILPQVYNGDHAIVYEIAVNNTIVASYSYRRNLTRTHNVWAKDETYGLGKDGLEWARSTVADFLRDSGNDRALSSLIDEYHFYFDPPRAAAANAKP